MKSPPPLKHLTRTDSGVALILTLSFVVIATILIVGFAASMRTERQAASSMANNEKVKVVAQAGLEHAIALLQKNIPQTAVPGVAPTAASGTNWYVNPGQLSLVAGGSTTPTVVPLHSGTSTSSTDPNLNQLKLDGTSYDILGTDASPMRVAWLDVLKDPSKASNKDNPLVARYAFWIDDENNKINLNTAGNKNYTSTSGGRFTNGNPTLRLAGGNYTLGHPASVDLEVLSGLTAQDVTDLIATTSSRQLGSVQEVKEFVSSGSPQAFFEANKFSLTHFNSDPEFNAFGKSRIFFAGSMAYPYSYGSTSAPNPFWDTGYAYRSEATTSGTAQANVVDPTEPLVFHSDLMQSINTYGFSGVKTPVSKPTTMAAANAVNGAGNPATTAVNRIASYLNTPWPGYTRSFVDKYGAREADQIAWNIYGMAAAATAPNTTNTTGAWANSTYLKSPYGAAANNNPRWANCLVDGPLSGAKILPQTRSPFITKVSVGARLSNETKYGSAPIRVKNSSGVQATDGNSATTPSDRIYGVAFHLMFEWYLPKGYQGFQTGSGLGNGSGWYLTDNKLYVVHLSGTFTTKNSSGVVTSTRRIVLMSINKPEAMCLAPSGDNTQAMEIGFREKKSGLPMTVTMDPNDPVGGDGMRLTNDSLFKMNTGEAAQVSGSIPSTWPTYGYTWDAVNDPIMEISDIKLRFVATDSVVDPSSSNILDKVPYQISPMLDIDGSPGFEAGTDTTGAINFPGTIVLNSGGTVSGTTLNGGSSGSNGWQGQGGDVNTNRVVKWLTMETTDPRVNQLASDWKENATYNPTLNGTWPIASNPGEVNLRGKRTLPAYPASSTDGDESKLAFPDVSLATTGRPSDKGKAFSSVGWLSTVSTGMQSGKPWRTLKFQPGGGQIVAGDPPDYLLMDLFAVPFNSLTLPAGQKFPNLTGAGPRTYMNATSGKVNVNAGIFPTGSNFTPPARTLPLQALFQNTYRGSTKIDASAAQDIASAVASGGPYTYSGQICEVPGVADTGANEWEKEALIRNLGSLITTRSNAFSVWGVAQTIKKVPKNLTGSGARPEEFQSGDRVTGERRFRAVVERYVWRGVDGIVGNAETDSSGAYSQLGANAWLGSPTNIKDGTDPLATSFEQSYNPQAAVMKYRVRSFEFLDE